jgi:DNA-binding NarL/FixJ family response regulator
MEERITVALVDDEILFRKGISFLLSREKNISIVFEGTNGFELISYLDSGQQVPDIILMDLKMPLLNGVEATKNIRKRFPSIKIIALTSYDSKSFVANMIHVGAISYLNKTTTPDELLMTINEVVKKGFYYSDYVMRVIKDNILTGTITSSVLDFKSLSNREVEVLKLICMQKSTVEIGNILFISPRTVDGHRNNLLQKTDSKNVAGLVVYAIQNNIVLID